MHGNKVLRIACFSCTLVLAGALRAQSVRYFEKEKLWLLSTDRNSYRLSSIDGKLLDKQQELTGAYLMGAGIHLNLRGDFDSTAVLQQRVQ